MFITFYGELKYYNSTLRKVEKLDVTSEKIVEEERF